MKCAWAAESSRMKSSVQLGLLCLSLFISSLHGDEVETESSKETPLNFEEPDFYQLEMYRVRRQTVSTEENKGKTVAVVPSRVNNKRKRPRPGSLSPLNDNPTMVVYHRTKRQEKSNTNKRKKRPGSYSPIGFVPLKPPQETDKVKRDAGE